LTQVFKTSSCDGISVLKVLGAIGVGAGLSIICIGILFRLNYWKGGNLNLILGIVETFIMLIIALVGFVKKKSTYYIRIFKRIAIIGGFGLIMAILSDLAIVKVQFRNHPDYIKTFEEFSKHPYNEELKEKLQIEYQKATMSEEEFERYRMYMDDQKKLK
jgi:hypothetical protein